MPALPAWFPRRTPQFRDGIFTIMLRQISILTTYRCDLHCEHCLRGFPKQQANFPIDLLDKLLTEALSFGIVSVRLTGGEPYLHPEFAEIVEKVTNYGLQWGFVTHGQRTKPYLPLIQRYREQFGYIKLSIDSSESALHDEIRGKEGAFDKVTASLKEYVQHEIPVWISASLNQKNKEQVDGLITLAEEHGATGIIFAGTIPTDLNQHLVLSDQQSLELYQQISEKKGMAKIGVQTASSLYTKGGVNFCPVLNLSGAHFSPNGDLIFCCDVHRDKATIGSLHDQSVSELLQGWLMESAQLQAKRTQMISIGKMTELFDTCAFCQAYFSLSPKA